MGCGDEKLSKYLTQTFIAHCNAMICQQVTLSGDAEWPKVADAVIEAVSRYRCAPGSDHVSADVALWAAGGRGEQLTLVRRRSGAGDGSHQQ
jgi:hypothetical protein